MTPGSSGSDADGRAADGEAPTREVDVDEESSRYVGTTLAGRYRVEARLGQGAMGAVYLAEHVRMERRDAIKVLAPDLADDEAARARFTREARNASRINHPNVCTVYDFGETDEGLPYIAMEYVEGETLTRLLEREGPLPPGRVADLAEEVTDALDAAHSRGIVHRDLKPDNIMLDRDELGSKTVKVVDFGIAKAARDEEGRHDVTREGTFLGTPRYVSPEQVEGAELDPRSDLYSLGVILFEMLTGRLPFSGETWQQVMTRRLSEEPLPLREAGPERELSPELERVVGKTLRREPEERYQSAEALGRDLRRAADGSGTGGVPATEEMASSRESGAESWLPDPDRWPGSWRAVLYGTALVVALSGAGALGVWALGDGGPGAESAAGGAGPANPAVSDAGGGAGGAAGGEPGAATGGTDGNAADDGDEAPATDTAAGGAPRDSEAHPAAAGDREEDAAAGPAPASTGQGDDPSPGERESSPAAELSPAGADSLLFRQLDRIADGGASVAGLRAAADSAREVWAIGAQPDSTRGLAAYVLAQALLEQGDRAGAERWLERAVALDPDGAGYRSLLESLRGPPR